MNKRDDCFEIGNAEYPEQVLSRHLRKSGMVTRIAQLEQQLTEARSILERTRYFVVRYSHEHVALDGPFQCLHQINDWLAANPE